MLIACDFLAQLKCLLVKISGYYWMKNICCFQSFPAKNREDREGMMPDAAAEEWYRELCAEYRVLTERQVAALAPTEPLRTQPQECVWVGV